MERRASWFPIPPAPPIFRPSFRWNKRASSSPPRRRAAALVAFCRTAADQVSEGLNASDWRSIRAAHEAWQLEFPQVKGVWSARNPGQRWTTFSRAGLALGAATRTYTWPRSRSVIIEGISNKIG